MATTVANVIGSLFGNPNRGPNRGIIDVIKAMGISIFRFNSGPPNRIDI